MKRLSNRAIALAALVGAGVACLACAKSKIQIDPNKEGISLCASQDEFADDTSGFNMATNKTSEMNKMSKASKAASRATEKEFQTGDVMGVYVHTQSTMPGSGAHSSNMKYVAKSASDWQASSALGGVLTAGGTYYVTGYYPFKSVVADPTKVVHTVAEDQSAAETTTATALEKSDFMSSAAAQMTGDLTKNPSATLNFKHRLAKLVVSVGIPTQIDGGMVSGVKSVIIGGTKIGCEVNITQTAGTVTATGMAKNIIPRLIDGSGAAGAITKYEAIVVPQMVTAGVDLVRITCTTSSGDKDLTYKVPTGGLTISAGVKLTLTLSSSADLAFLTGLDLTSGLAQTNLPLTVKIGVGKSGTLSSNQSWITLSKTLGGSYAQSISGIAQGEQTVYVKVVDNNSAGAAPREAMLSLTDNMSGAATYPVVQNYYRFSVSATSVQIDKEGTAVALPTVDANQVWTISATLPSWLKIVVSTGGVPVWSTSSSVAFPYSVIGDLNPSGKVTLYAVADKTTLFVERSHSIKFNGTNVTIIQSPVVPPESITINGLKWATGNLIASGANDCTIGLPTDCGLYFQFGSLTGWSGGANGDGTGAPSTSPGLAVKVGPVISWSDSNYGGDPIADPNSFDPCRKYLGSPWRMPTTAEIASMCNGAPAGATSWNTWAQVGGEWTTYNGSPGGWINGTSLANNGLFFPASGRRSYSAGSFSDVSSYGYCWSSTIYSNDRSYSLYFHQSNGLLPQNRNDRAYGLPVRCVQDLPHVPNPPRADQIVTINDLKWTTGNLVATGAHNCMVGAPSDGGLYFQFGSLIGWKGGSDGNGYGIGQWKHGAANGNFWGSSFSWSTEAAVWPEKFTNGPSGIGTTWPQYNRYDNVYFFGYKEGSYATGGQNIRDFAGFANGDLATATTAVGDPCSYYLGTDWRMPTREEFKTLCRNAPAGETSWNSWSQVGGQWATYSPSVGGWINGTSFGANGLFFPASGNRNYSNGSVDNVTSDGYCWSSSVYNAGYGYYLRLNQSNGVFPWVYDYRSHGFPVRCVQ